MSVVETGARRCVVVGAGIAGLSAARGLALSGRQVTILEGSARAGGKLARTTFDGLAGLPLSLDVGAESMLARRPEGLELITELGLTERRATPTPNKPQVLIDGRIRTLPPSAMGVPTDLDALEGYLSPAGLDRARREPELPAPPLTGDVAIGAYLDDRFGPEVTDRLLEPLLGGVYAGRSRELSFAAVNPSLFALASAGGSLLAAARALTGSARPAAAGPVFAGIEGGITALVDALVDDLLHREVELRCSSPVHTLERTGDRFRLGVGLRPRVGGRSDRSDRTQMIEADEVVLATPAAATSRLLRDGLAPEAAEALAQIPYASVAVITMLVRGTELSGSGLLIPPGELPTVKALTYADRKWAWVDRATRAYAGEPLAVVRASVGRHGEAALLQLDDPALIRRTADELRALVPGWAQAELVEARVQRWGGGLPQYLVGHPGRIELIRATVAAVPGLRLAGAYLDGVGIPACIKSGYAAAEQLTRQ